MAKSLMVRVAENREEKYKNAKLDMDTRIRNLEDAAKIYAKEARRTGSDTLYSKASKLYAKLGEHFDSAGDESKAARFYTKASISSAKAGSEADAGRYAGIAARRFERESMNPENDLLQQSRYARRAAESYGRAVKFGEKAGRATAGIERTEEQLKRKAKQLAKMAEKGKAKAKA